jgi:hypothetical protein
VSSAPREPILREVDGLGAVPTTLEHLGPYGALIGAIRAELQHFATTDLRLHLAIAEGDRFLLTSIDVEDAGNEDAGELLERFRHEFAPEQVKHYLAKEIIARLPNAGAIDLSQFAGLNATREARGPKDDEAYAELLKELRSGEPAAGKRRYEVTLVGRWSDHAQRTGGATTSRRPATLVTPLAGRALAIDIEDARGSRRIELAAVVPGRRYVVGKDQGCDVVVDGVYASRRHCEFWLDKDVWWVTDSGSTNGIRVESSAGAPECRSSHASGATASAVLQVEPGARIVLSVSADGDARQYPRLALRPAVEGAGAARAPITRAPVTPIAAPRRPASGLSVTVQMASGRRSVDLPREPGPFRVGRSRTQGLVIDWSHEGVSGHHVDIVEPDETGALVVVHGDNGVTVAGVAYARGTEFRWKVGETMVFGRATQQEPECSLTLSRRA